MITSKLLVAAAEELWGDLPGVGPGGVSPPPGREKAATEAPERPTVLVESEPKQESCPGR